MAYVSTGHRVGSTSMAYVSTRHRVGSYQHCLCQYWTWLEGYVSSGHGVGRSRAATHPLASKAESHRLSRWPSPPITMFSNSESSDPT
eukprot:2946342-Rhodomonas_salina.4